MHFYPYIIFDLDGTLLDSLTDIADSVNHTLLTFDLPQKTTEEIRNAVGNGARNLLIQCVENGEDHPRFEEILLFYQNWYAAHCTQHTKPFPGIVDLLTQLKAAGSKLAVLSNKPQESTDILCDTHFPNLIDVVMGEQQGIPRKPNPQSTLSIMQRFSAKPSQTIFVGDSPVDVKTAQNAGIACVSVGWGLCNPRQLLLSGASKIAQTSEMLRSFLMI